jgi:hypothetical protein
MQGSIALLAGAGMLLQATPGKSFGAQDQRGIRVSFLLGTFLWTSKEKFPARRCGNRHSIRLRDSETLNYSYFSAWAQKACPPYKTNHFLMNLISIAGNFFQLFGGIGHI